jgi:hypothetical protein
MLQSSSQGNFIDLVGAYRSLKLAMSKNVKGLGDAKEQVNNKNFLKPTIASMQTNKPNGPYQNYVLPQVAEKMPSILSGLPHPQRVGTAPTTQNRADFKSQMG